MREHSVRRGGMPGPGDRLGGRYVLREQIGRGGMGLIYLAEHVELGREVVVKLLGERLLDDDESVARFEREARGLSQLDHPNIVTIYDYGRDGGLAYIAMEYIDGETLRARVRREGALEVEAFAAIAMQIVDALAEAHRLGVMHRDIKPANIMICRRGGRDGVVKVLDFGLARLVAGGQRLTSEEVVLGTVPFLAPEVIQGAPPDLRADVYAMGIMFYWMLSGRRPFCGDDNNVLIYHHVQTPPPPLSEQMPQGRWVDPELEGLVMRCLAKNPDDRPANAGILRRQLEQVIEGRSSARLVPEPSAARGLSGHRSSPAVDPEADTGSQRLPASSSAPHPSPMPTADASPASGLLAPTGGQPVAPADWRPALMAISLGLVALVVVVAVLLLQGPIEPQAPSPAAAPPTASQLTADSTSASATDDDFVASSLDRVEAAIAAGQLGQAEQMLDALKQELRGDAAQFARAASLREAIIISRLEHRAASHEASGQRDEALETWRAVLARDASHARAQARLQVLQRSGAGEEEAVTAKAGAEGGAVRRRPSPRRRARPPVPRAIEAEEKEAEQAEAPAAPEADMAQEEEAPQRRVIRKKRVRRVRPVAEEARPARTRQVVPTVPNHF